MTASNGFPGLVTIVLPAKNEEEAIGATLRALPLSTLKALGFETEVVVLDGNSRDRTAPIARAWGARVLTDPGRGKGFALRSAVPEFRGDFVVMLDADGTYAADAIPRALAPLVRNEADVVMGHRLLQPGSMKGTHLVANVAVSMLASALYGRLCLDLCTGLWAFRTEALRSLPLKSRGFDLEAELFALTMRLGMRIQEIRVDYLPRQGTNNLAFGQDGLTIVRRLMRSRFLPIGTEEGEPEDPASSRPKEVSA
jgi:dolichol-phosphate mannosyltransferase